MLSSLALYLQSCSYMNWYYSHIQWSIWPGKPGISSFLKECFQRFQMIYILVLYFISHCEYMIICNICVYICIYSGTFYIRSIYISIYWDMTFTSVWIQHCSVASPSCSTKLTNKSLITLMEVISFLRLKYVYKVPVCIEYALDLSHC